MQKLLLLIILAVLNGTAAFSQTDSLSAKDKALLDSMMENDAFLKLMEENNKSYFDVNIGVSNGIFSTKNNSLNAEQAVTKKIFLTPTVAYYHKSGLGIAAGGYVSADSGSLKMYQYMINPFYSYTDKKVEVGISYTRFIAGAAVNSFSVSPYKNDIYGKIKLAKPWLQPGLALGFANGKYEELFDSSFTVFVAGVPRTVRITDTITTKVKDFSISLSAEHEFDLGKLFTKKDNITLIPSVLVNGSSQKWTISHSNSINKRRPAVQNLLKTTYGDGSEAAAFQIQSVAFSGYAVYTAGKFYVQPQLYLDYYLPATTENRFTAVFALTAGLTF
jgi:hypothetical protein